MREDILNRALSELESRRAENEREETARLDRIRKEFPDIYTCVEERRELVFGTIRKILDGSAKAEDLPGRMNGMNQRISSMLEKAGLGTEYLSPVVHCTICGDTGYIGESIRKPCSCLKKVYQEKLREEIGLGQDSAQTFEKYNEQLIPDEPVNGSPVTQRKLSQIARDQCEKWADHYPDVKHRDILLTGSSGLGKTFLLHAMAARLIEREQNVLLINAYSFLQMARKSYFDGETGVQELMDVPVLMMDDLGSEPLMQNVTVEQLFNLINERQNKGLSTVISTNLTLQEIRERYTERIASRLNNPGSCLVLTLAGKDLRKTRR